MKVLVTGATGYIGNRLLHSLQASGHDVKVLVRSRVDPIDSLENIEQVVGNLAVPDSLENVTQDVETVFHLGGGMRPSDGNLTAVNVDGTRRLMKDAIKHRVRRFIYLSAAVVYGDIVTPPASEGTVCNPLRDHAYAISKMQAEEQLLSLGNDKTDVVIIRIPQVYSAGSPSITRFPQLAAMVEGNNTTHFVHREDVVRAILMLASSDYAPGIYNVADDQPLTVHDAASIIRKSLGTADRKPQGQATIPPMLRRVMEATLVLDTSKIRHLGFSLKYPSLEEGIFHEK
ncbi:NAD(P)-dependent oxidoreductase [Alicyclobacillus sp. SO9]|uniref:NAD-dependent epimerase/dehydratase family protein n=1 Tax=Alicyclobacillus sp. SO9 TaxID=2665646 RepID=UPI0018E76F87|nr:NAD(P)-dependent oxidoreductase [Alicyclobacillus sp. SO9]QQE78798.1 NAD(P)-dependent oxidoreductase [Alicyclobacillus sp. SO9]